MIVIMEPVFRWTVERHILEQAMQARDPRFDGRFFIAVKTTGIYCRPVCTVKAPQMRNVVFFPTAAAAAEAGFRPCLRCRPESSPGTPAWSGTSTTVTRGLRLIGEGALDAGGVEALSDRLGVTSRHLSRLFMQHLGASPKAIAQTRRLHFAKKLLDETNLPMTEIALAAGYGSVRSFNAHFKSTYDRAPSELRQRKVQHAETGFRINLQYRPPYDFASILQFLAVRATPGVEFVCDGTYRRNILLDDEPGGLVVHHDPDRHQLRCEIGIGSSRSLMDIVARIRRLFDLDADPLEINACLQQDSMLAGIVGSHSGRRIAGAWDAFEVSVRAVVGQQVSVKGATTVMGRIARQYGESRGDKLMFPAPAALARLSPDDLPMPRRRGEAIRLLAAAVASGEIDLSGRASAPELIASLTKIKGIGPWTAQYIAMRALNDPDAFLHGDLVLLRIAREQLGIDSSRQLLEHAERWRPWRAYAGMHLWGLAGQQS